MFYHSGDRAPRCHREVGSRELTAKELDRLGLGDQLERLPVDPDSYTPESLTPDGRFVFTVPTDPDLSCDIHLPSQWLYPAEAEEVFRNRVKLLRENERSRLRVIIKEVIPHRKYFYRCSYREVYASE